ncbi:MAG: phage tail protein [Mogibacterium sp.]|nr:phage tail protein [Mogibacterium sp.]
MTYPISGVNFSSIAVQNIILAKPNTFDDPQPFRIYSITRPLEGIVTINARHVSYDLSGVIVDMGLTATSAGAALSQMAAHCSGIGNFTFTSDNATTANWYTGAPATFRSMMGGVEGSILDRFGGEYHYNIWEVANMANRGADRGFTIRYGKNLIDIEQEEECANCYTGVKAFWQKDGNTIESLLVPTGINLGYDRNLLIDATEDFETMPNDLSAYVEAYIDSHELTSPKVSINLSFQQIDKDYLERVTLCDTVHVYFESLGVDATAKIITTVYDVLRDRYESLKIGSVRTTLADTITTVQKEAAAAPTKSSMQDAIDRATNLLAGVNGGYVVLNRDANGEPYEILIMDSPDINTAQKIWRWNQNGLGYSSDYGHSYGLAMTSDGQIVADYINTGILQSGDGQSFYLNLLTGELRMKAADIYLGNQNLSDTLSAVSENAADIAELSNYLNYNSSTGVVTLGDRNSEIALKVENDRVAFVDVGSDVELAYFTNDRLMIKDATIINSLDFGNYRLDTQYNGITFRWVG